MKQQTPKVKHTRSISFTKNKKEHKRVKLGGFAAEIITSVQTTVSWKSQRPIKRCPQYKSGLPKKVDAGLLIAITIIAAGPFLIQWATNYFDWFVATDIARHLGTALKPQQINLLLDKMFDVLIIALASKLAS
jgi:hypothetical protein